MRTAHNEQLSYILILLVVSRTQYINSAKKFTGTLWNFKC